ncbi:MAG: hypothetical protein CVV64_14155 [Candidatus Wallbacteria bacterium HGW-Wallbacteria-1]|jgi:hypothetical protein|uniref:Glycoside hydrolase family 5 domain-containing protein n=1 Tax=Candidatus Wallbacteria bacterium HGW-Wallbacteria-1 TaxID=2013854 RepID=A0A2N1PMI0_9BACT|nr:MAG: hypothetical protein CVV64_14155 [Candidatus Wallbacteria bacterium HGW-Wallbacteria-1]
MPVKLVKLFVLVFLLNFLALPILFAEQKKTRLGVFHLPEPGIFPSLGLEAVRAIIKDSNIKDLFAQLDRGVKPENIKILKLTKSFKRAGTDLIVTLRWPDYQSVQLRELIDGRDNINALYDRVPLGRDRAESLALLSRFIEKFGDQIKVISLQNECLGGPGRYHENDMTGNGNGKFSNAGEWLAEVAKTVFKIRAANPRLSHLKIASPVWQGITKLIEMKMDIPVYSTHPKVNLIAEIAKISNQYCDFVDLHFLENPISEWPAIISYVRKYTSLPLITTEWAGLANVKTWLNEPISALTKDLLIASFGQSDAITNSDFVKIAHEKKLQRRFWEKFMTQMPHEKDFMISSFKLMQKEGFAYACWALGLQYGHSVFDLNTLFANLTTNERFAPNEPVFSELIKLVEYLKSEKK